MLYLIISNVIALLVAIFFTRRYYTSRYIQRTFRRLIDHINIGYYRYRSRDGVVVAANKGFSDIRELGVKPEGVFGRSLSELLIFI